MRNSVSWDCSCIIGFGNHAKSKILPALENVGIKIGGIVSSKDQLMLPGVEIFTNVADAIKFLPTNKSLFMNLVRPGGERGGEVNDNDNSDDVIDGWMGTPPTYGVNDDMMRHQKNQKKKKTAQ